jgi:hypothetical protein
MVGSDLVTVTPDDDLDDAVLEDISSAPANS